MTFKVLAIYAWGTNHNHNPTQHTWWLLKSCLNSKIRQKTSICYSTISRNILRVEAAGSIELYFQCSVSISTKICALLPLQTGCLGVHRERPIIMQQWHFSRVRRSSWHLFVSAQLSGKIGNTMVTEERRHIYSGRMGPKSLSEL